MRMGGTPPGVGGTAKGQGIRPLSPSPGALLCRLDSGGGSGSFPFPDHLDLESRAPCEWGFLFLHSPPPTLGNTVL